MVDALKLPFAGEEVVRRLSSTAAEPAWLREDRTAAAADFARLPVESNQLYTGYVDFRAADLSGARAAGARTAVAPSGVEASALASVGTVIRGNPPSPSSRGG